MALKITKKAEKKKKPEPPVEHPTLPEGGDRFVWTAIPVAEKPMAYAPILKGQKPPS